MILEHQILELEDFQIEQIGVGLGRSTGGGNGNPLQYFYQESLMDREAWPATVQACMLLLQSCLTVRQDRSPPGCSVQGILQARILERVAMPSSKGSSQPRDRLWSLNVSCIGRRVLYPLVPRGKPELQTKESQGLDRTESLSTQAHRLV